MALVKSTARQRAASRANGAKSKGPKTAEGKAASAGNAATHHLYAQKLGLSPTWARFATLRALEKAESITDPGERLLVYHLWLAQAQFEHAQRTLWACRHAAALELRADAKTVDHWLATQQKLLKSLCNHHRLATIQVQDAITRLTEYRSHAVFSGTTTNPQLMENKHTASDASAAPAPVPALATFHTFPALRAHSAPPPQPPPYHPVQLLATLASRMMTRRANPGLNTAPHPRPDGSALFSQTTSNPQLTQNTATSHLLQFPYSVSYILSHQSMTPSGSIPSTPRPRTL